MLKYTNCLDPGFGHENGDGYVRICDKPRPEGGLLVMRHRWFWELLVGPVPEGHEINHLCKNRRCCNVEHLECLPATEHRSKDNAERYADIISEGCEMLRNGYSPSEVALATGRKRATILEWIRKGWDVTK
jgi:hypothetical protein